MINCRKCKDMIIEALYGELGPAERELFDSHLRSCPDCASEYSVLGATLRVMDERRRPDPGPEFWDGYWDRLVARMERGEAVPAERVSFAARVGGLFSLLPRWSYQAAAGVALVVLGILIGRSLLSPPAPVSLVEQAGPAASALPVANNPPARAQQFIERSQLLLLGLVNYDPKTQDLYALDMPRKKAISREMATQAVAIQNSLTDPRQQMLRELIADLRVIMMQIANLGAGSDLDGVELVKQGVQQEGIFLKIDLTRMAFNARGPQGPSSQQGLKPSGPSPKNKI